MLTETARIKQNRAENAKPSQFSRVFSEVSGSLARDKEIQQAVTELYDDNALFNNLGCSELKDGFALLSILATSRIGTSYYC